MGKIREVLFGEYSNFQSAISNPTKVKSLKICLNDTHCDLSLLGKEFLMLSNLRALNIQTDISHPPFLPQEIGKLIRLEKLRILNVPFQVYPNWINELTNLKALMIRGNDISSIPESVGNLKNLVSLRIENCDISQLPKSLIRLEKLEYLSLIITKIKHISPDSLPPNLKVLNLTLLQIDGKNSDLLKRQNKNLKVIQG